MGLNDTVSAERIHIGFYGMRNAGKSSLANAICAQQISLVSDVKGTTTDPVKKAMELLPLGPVVILDTPGLDDEGDLGELRVKRAREMLAKTNIALLVVDATLGKTELDLSFEEELKSRKIPYLTIYNKSELLENKEALGENELYASAKTGDGIEKIKEKLGEFAKAFAPKKLLISDLIKEKDIIILVTPIDESAPKGRLILPQQMVLRDVLDSHAIPIVCQVEELSFVLSSLNTTPRMVITDSQAFGKVSKIVPKEIPLTSFSILMARYKGDLPALAHGFSALKKLRDGDRVLICEGCTHHRQCNDIGTVKMPAWIEGFTNAKPEFSFTSGGDFPEDLTKYKVIVHCGGCMLNEAEMQNRIRSAEKANIPIVNYGIAIAGMHGILERSVSLFPDIL